MKKWIFLIAIASSLVACAPQRSLQNVQKQEAIVIADDSLQHEIIIIDPDFERWYLSRYNQAMDRSDSYYQSMNRIGALNWNQYYNTGKYFRIISSYLDYQPGIDYGLEVNRKLYWYFKYIEEQFRVPLLR